MGKEFTRQTQLTGKVDALGHIHFFDDFSYDLGYNEIIVGNGEAVRSIENSIVKGISLKHQVAADTATASDSVRSQKHIPCSPDKLVEYLCYFNFSGANTPHTLRFKFTLTDGTSLLQFSIEFCINNHTLKYLNSVGGYTPFTTYSAPPDDDVWHKISFRVDGLNRKYISCNIDNDEFSLADISCQVTTGRSCINHYIDVYTLGTADTNFDVYYDHLLLQSFT